MKVVVELNKEEMESYKNLLRLGFGNTAMRKIINGTPLPKGHGDLALVEIPYGINGCNSCPMHERLWCCVTKECDVAHEEMSVIGRHNCCPVIKVIKADKEGTEG